MKHKRWMRVIVVGIDYAVVGVAFTEMSKRIATDQTRLWRLAA
jgi:hypothetical protein